jgi:hypothetical protein
VVHVEAHERDELVGQVWRERGDEHQHDARDWVADRGEVEVDGRADLPNGDEEHDDDDELREDERHDERRPASEPTLRGIPGEPGECDGREDNGDQQQRLTDEQREPHDARTRDAEPGKEDRDDRTDAGRGDVDRRQPSGEQGHAVADALHRVARRLHDADGELIGDLQQGCGEGDGDERSEHRLGESHARARQCHRISMHEPGDELEAEEDEHDEDRHPEQHVVDRDVLASGHVDERGRVEHRPHALEQPGGGLPHCLRKPVERRGDERRGSLTHGIAH